MTKDEKYVDIMLLLVISGESVNSHTKDCDICLNYEVSGQSDLYTLKCGDGWLLRHDLGLIVEKADKVLGII